MGYTLSDSLAWTSEGTELFLARLSALSDQQVAAPIRLEGWTGRHLLAHISGNALGLCNLVRWARTGEETPMYVSIEARNADIEAGALLEVTELRQRAESSALTLEAEVATLSGEQWSTVVRTSQGTDMPATDIPWLRAREVMIHAVDLDASLTMDGLPLSFLRALVDEVVERRGVLGRGPALVLRDVADSEGWSIAGDGEPRELVGSMGSIAGYLVGRGTDGLTTGDGDAVPEIPRWL